MTIQFIWDPAKAEMNRRKHGVRFEDAMRVFADPFHLSRQDRIEGGEHRWQTIGRIDGIMVLLVAHTVGGEDDQVEVIRLISARKATRKERRRYEDETG